MEHGHNRDLNPQDCFDPVLMNPIKETIMHITDLNECLSELPEISILEFFRPRSPVSGPFSWSMEQPVDRPSYNETRRPQAA